MKKVWKERTQFSALVALIATVVALLAGAPFTWAMAGLAVVAGVTAVYSYWRYWRCIRQEVEERLTP